LIRDFNPQMVTPRLENYLRTYRKRSGLTQHEVGFLLGRENGAQVSRYEKRHRLPPLETALACEEIFGAPVSELFAGLRQKVGRDINKRRVALRARLQAKPLNAHDARMTAHKLRSLDGRERPVVAHHNAPTT
jgi:transcriptional regulator with XRE-family HTH domain